MAMTAITAKEVVGADRADTTKLRHFTRVSDLTPQAFAELLELAEELKADSAHCEDALRGQTIACIFEKPSTRTRVSFAAAAARLGATPVALSPQELQLVERHRLNRIEIFYDPIRDELNADAERAHERAKARGWFVTKARDAAGVCTAEIHALVSTIRALRAFNITVRDLVRGVTITNSSLQAIGEIEQILTDCIDHIDRSLQTARRYADEAEDIFAPGTDDDTTVPPNQWPRIWTR